MDDPLVYLNGDMLPLSQAHVPVLDRGFIFGDGIYEVIPVYGRRMFRPEQHLQRFFNGMEAIRIANPYRREQWLTLLENVIAAQPLEDQSAYLQVTRGVARRTHAFPAGDVTPTVFIMSNPLMLPSAHARAHGAACVTMEDKRWLRCEIKSISLLGNVLAAQYAVDHDANETIQFRGDALTEGSSSNVWIVKQGVLLGPPRDNLILEGIRYGLMEELCRAGDIPMQARRIARAEVLAADEVLLTSAAKEVLAVVTIDGQSIGSGRPGPIYQTLYDAYQAAKRA
jgi:D-alanine transaminase